MSLKDTASDGFSQDVTRLERRLDESDRYALSLANLLTDQLVLCVPVLGSLALAVLFGKPYRDL